MKPLIAVLVLTMAGIAAYGQPSPSPIITKASADFDKVDASPIPNIADTMACVQSNAAALAAVRVEERYIYQYRRGYCALFGATVTGAAEGFKAAATDFNAAVAGWPKKLLAGPPPGLRALISIAMLEQGRAADSYPEMTRELTAIAADKSCANSPVMPVSFCTSLVDTAGTWLAWLAYRRSDFAHAAQYLQPFAGSPWNLFVSGRIAHEQRRLPEATTLYQKALDTWSAAQKSPNPDTVFLLGPKLDISAVNYQLGLIDYSSQRYQAAITHFDAALKESPRNSYVIFLRARAKEALKLTRAALDDYALATQTARATNDSSWSVGQAHYSRGVLLYRDKDFGRAELEFSTAAGARLTEVTQADVTAWRLLSSVAGGGCKPSGDLLEAAAKSASDFFPKTEADQMVLDCRVKSATTPDQLVALEKQYAGRLDAARMRDLHSLIASAYADQGVAAEDRKDSYAAVLAYRRAIEVNPANTKARFNLGAIYIEKKDFSLAEAEYRALVQADGSDHEAQYWLAQSILAQRPPPERVAAACQLLRQSLAVEDAARKAQFTRALAAAKCPN